jgi:hypothetical protein
MKPRDRFDYSNHWPSCYSSQDDAGIDRGPLNYPDTDDHSKDWQDYFAIGVAIGLLFGLALGDIWSAIA